MRKSTMVFPSNYIDDVIGNSIIRDEMDQSASIFEVTWPMVWYHKTISHMCNMGNHTHRLITYILDSRIYLSQPSSYDKCTYCSSGWTLQWIFQDVTIIRWCSVPYQMRDIVSRKCWSEMVCKLGLEANWKQYNIKVFVEIMGGNLSTSPRPTFSLENHWSLRVTSVSSHV